MAAVDRRSFAPTRFFDLVPIAPIGAVSPRLATVDAVDQIARPVLIAARGTVVGTAAVCFLWRRERADSGTEAVGDKSAGLPRPDSREQPELWF
jgi:hypothetical protein